MATREKPHPFLAKREAKPKGTQQANVLRKRGTTRSTTPIGKPVTLTGARIIHFGARGRGIQHNRGREGDAGPQICWQCCLSLIPMFVALVGGLDGARLSSKTRFGAGFRWNGPEEGVILPYPICLPQTTVSLSHPCCRPYLEGRLFPSRLWTRGREKTPSEWCTSSECKHPCKWWVTTALGACDVPLPRTKLTKYLARNTTFPLVLFNATMRCGRDQHTSVLPPC